MTADAQPAVTLTVDQAHQLIGKGNISRCSFYSAVRRGQVPHLRIGSRILIPRKAFSAWLDSAGDPGQIDVGTERFDPWAMPAWDFVCREREAWQASGKSAPFTVSVSAILEALGVPAGTAKTRRDSNRLCRILRAKGLVYQRRRVFAADGSPIFVGNTARQLLEYQFRWPEITAGLCSV